MIFDTGIFMVPYIPLGHRVAGNTSVATILVPLIYRPSKRWKDRRPALIEQMEGRDPSVVEWTARVYPYTHAIRILSTDNHVLLVVQLTEHGTTPHRELYAILSEMGIDQDRPYCVPNPTYTLIEHKFMLGDPNMIDEINKIIARQCVLFNRLTRADPKVWGFSLHLHAVCVFGTCLISAPLTDYCGATTAAAVLAMGAASSFVLTGVGLLMGLDMFSRRSLHK